MEEFSIDRTTKLIQGEHDMQTFIKVSKPQYVSKHTSIFAYISTYLILLLTTTVCDYAVACCQTSIKSLTYNILLPFNT